MAIRTGPGWGAQMDNDVMLGLAIGHGRRANAASAAAYAAAEGLEQAAAHRNHSMTFRMIEPADLAVFGAWDGMLTAGFFVVAGVLCRTLVKMMRKTGSTDPTLTIANTVGTVIAAFAVAGGIAAWIELPHNAVGIWGIGAAAAIFLAYRSALQFMSANGLRKPR